MAQFDAILLSGGRGKRFEGSFDQGMGSSLPKQFSKIADIPVLAHSLRALLEISDLRRVVVTCPRDRIQETKNLIQEYVPNETRPIDVVVGGKERLDSSRLALEALEELSGKPPTRVLIHDGCRPFLSKPFLKRIEAALNDRAFGAWIPVIAQSDTIKEVDNRQVVSTLDRSKIYRVQTPQIFEYSVIRSLVDRVKNRETAEFTDDASLCEHFGIPVGVFEGDPRNLKLTYAFEMTMLRALFAGDTRSCEWASDMTSTV